MNLKNNKHIPLDKFVDMALYNPKKGFYMKKNPIGKSGDFITSPNISFLFTEMISIWIVSFWQSLRCRHHSPPVDRRGKSFLAMIARRLLRSLWHHNKLACHPPGIA